MRRKELPCCFQEERMDTRGFAAIIAAILLAVSVQGEPDPKPVQVDYFGIPASQYPSEVYRYDPRANNYPGYTQVALTQYNPLLHQLGGYYLNTPSQGGYEAPGYAVTESPVAGRYDYDGRGGYVNRPLVRVRPLIYNNIDYPAKTPNTYSNNNYPNNYYQRQQSNGYVSRPYYDTNYNGVTRKGVAGDDGRYYQGEQGAYTIRGGVFPTTEYDSTDNRGRDYRLQNGDSNAYYQNHRPNYNSYSYENSRHSGYSPQIQSGGETRGYYNDKDGYDGNGNDGRKDGYGAQQSERKVYSVSQPRSIVPVRGVTAKEPQTFYPAKRDDQETKNEK
ncbi:hypothetical protein J437_LFUL011177 [Ladona fulva]|uniref:Uncharacterized protein n=1 Tax=Ladona fulva TaxID=123851 RepID=A0A8K0KB21_LADFU|nr:hypothetical protein J437_LFUL011177 [Ladona fulva]